jgi:hypothetical protein
VKCPIMRQVCSGSGLCGAYAAGNLKPQPVSRGQGRDTVSFIAAQGGDGADREAIAGGGNQPTWRMACRLLTANDRDLEFKARPMADVDVPGFSSRSVSVAARIADLAVGASDSISPHWTDTAPPGLTAMSQRSDRCAYLRI